MTKELKLFFDNFDKLAESPGGVQKLRELILQLAVQGELVPQNPKDEPASELLKKIKAEKEKLIKEGKIKEAKPLPPIRSDEIPYELPNGWKWVRLGSISDISTGSRDVNEGNPSGKYPFFTCAAEPLRSETYSIEGESLILPGNGANVGLVSYFDGKCELYQRTYAVMNLKIYGKYIFSYLKAYFKKRLEGQHFGSAINYIKIGNVTDFLIAVPPLDEQKRIVKKVDELMALCDDLEEKQKKAAHRRVVLNNSAIDHLLIAGTTKDFDRFCQLICDNFDLLYDDPENVNKFRQAILKLAVQGKLVSQNPKDEPASELIKKIKVEKEQLIKKKETRKPKTFPTIDDSEIPYNIPLSWRWVRLEDICRDWGQKKPDVDFTYIDVTAIDKEKGVISDNFTILKPSEAPSRARKIVSKGTVIYSTVRPYLLNIAIIDRNFTPEPIVSTAFGILHPLSGIFNKFLYWYLRSKPFIAYVESEMTGMAYPAINDTKLYAGLVPIPPAKEQKRIVAKVDELMALCDQLEEKIKQSKEKSEKLMNATIHHLLVT